MTSLKRVEAAPEINRVSPEGVVLLRAVLCITANLGRQCPLWVDLIRAAANAISYVRRRARASS